MAVLLMVHGSWFKGDAFCNVSLAHNMLKFGFNLSGLCGYLAPGGGFETMNWLRHFFFFFNAATFIFTRRSENSTCVTVLGR